MSSDPADGHKTCYLCGLAIEGEPSVDHVPPKQFFAREIRRQENLDQLTTLPTHTECNRAFGRDEEYATAILTVAAERAPAALEIIEQFQQRFRAGKSLGLGYKILDQLVERPSGLYLPGGMAKMEVDGDRIQRVLFKVARGLYWLEHEEVVPEDTPCSVEIFEPMVLENPRLPEIWEAVKGEPGRGIYPRVFDFKYLSGQAADARFHAWGMLLWDSVMVLVTHPPPRKRSNDGKGA